MSPETPPEDRSMISDTRKDFQHTKLYKTMALTRKQTLPDSFL